MTTPDDTTPDDTQADPQSHLDHDPSNRPDPDDPAHGTGDDEGPTSEGGTQRAGPATDS